MTYEDAQKLKDAILKKEAELMELLHGISNREGALARTNLEQAMMWAQKAIDLVTVFPIPSN